MTKMKQAMGLAVLLMGTALLVGCSSPPAEETKPPTTGATPHTGEGTPPGTNATQAGKATPN